MRFRNVGLMVLACLAGGCGQLVAGGALAASSLQGDPRVAYVEKQREQEAEARRRDDEQRREAALQAAQAKAKWEAEHADEIAADRAAQEAEAARIAEQKRREEEAKAAAILKALEAKAALDRRRSEDAFQRDAWSGVACFWRDVRRRITEETNTAKRYSREFGVVNLTRMDGLQKQGRYADERAETVTRELRQAGHRPVACTDPLMASVVACVRARVQVAGGETCQPVARTSELVDAAVEWDAAMVERGAFWPR